MDFRFYSIISHLIYIDFQGLLKFSKFPSGNVLEGPN